MAKHETIYLCEGTRVRSFFDTTEKVPLYQRQKASEMHCGFDRDIDHSHSEKLGLGFQNPYEILSKERKV